VKPLFPGLEGVDSNALYSPSGHLLDIEEDHLKARTFDATRLEFTSAEANCRKTGI
jgi:hypothetical protein